MSDTNISTPAETSAPAVTTPEAPAVTETPVSKLRQLINERFADKPTDKPVEEPAVPTTEGKPESEAPVESEEPKKPDNRLELNLAKANQELKKLTTESVKLKSEYATATKELQSIKQQFDANPLKALEQATGKSLKDIFEAAKRGDYDDQIAKLPSEVREKLSYVEQLQAKEREREAKAAEEAKAEARKQEFTKAIPQVKSLLEADADKYPFLAVVESNSEQVLTTLYEQLDKGETPNVQQIFEDLNKEVQDLAKFWVQQPKLLKQLVASDESTKNIILEALGLNKQTQTIQQSRSVDAPKLTSISTLTEVKSRTDKRPTKAERDQEIKEEWARMRASQK